MGGWWWGLREGEVGMVGCYYAVLDMCCHVLVCVFVCCLLLSSNSLSVLAATELVFV